MILAGLVGGSMVADKDEKGLGLPFPADGKIEACVRGTLSGNVALLQPVSDTPAAIIAPIQDAGTVLAVERAIAGGGYTIKRYAIGEVLVAGTLDRLPTAAQLDTLLETKGAKETAIRSRVSITADGKTTSNVSSDALE